MKNPKGQFTYDEWREKGYGIKKGEHHSGRNEKGICTFSENQVLPLPGTIKINALFDKVIRREIRGLRFDIDKD